MDRHQAHGGGPGALPGRPRGRSPGRITPPPLSVVRAEESQTHSRCRFGRGLWGLGRVAPSHILSPARYAVPHPTLYLRASWARPQRGPLTGSGLALVPPRPLPRGRRALTVSFSPLTELSARQEGARWKRPGAGVGQHFKAQGAGPGCPRAAGRHRSRQLGDWDEPCLRLLPCPLSYFQRS